MEETRVSWDADLKKVAKHLRVLNTSQLHELAIWIYERGKEFASFDNAIADETISLLRRREKVPKDLRERLQTAADEADENYLDIWDDENGNDNRSPEDMHRAEAEFRKARLLTALVFAAHATKVMFLESIYESFIGGERDPTALEYIRTFGLD